MKVLALSRYGRKGASSRVRMIQYSPWLSKRGIDLKVVHFLDDEYLERRYRDAPTRRSALEAYMRRISALASAGRADLIWIEKEALPLAPWAVEKRLLPQGVPIVSDYDDAVFHNYDLHRSPLVRAALGRKIDAVMRASRLVTAGNAYLAQRARDAGAREVAIVPTVVDTDAYQPRPCAASDARATIGWIGTPSTWAAYMAPLTDVFAETAAATEAELLAVGAADSEAAAFKTLPWSEDTEVSLIQAMDIGVMPLDDSPWSQGKCGYKLIQYMACGLPVVASPVGVNKDIVEHGVNGFLAQDTREWREALERLVSDEPLRRRMGAAGRAKVEREYSIQVWGPKVAQTMLEIAHRKDAAA